MSQRKRPKRWSGSVKIARKEFSADRFLKLTSKQRNRLGEFMLDFRVGDQVAVTITPLPARRRKGGRG